MSNLTRSHRRRLGIALAAGAIAFGATDLRGQEGSPAPDSRAGPGLMVDARLALHALASLSDAHLRKTADFLTLVAGTDAARAADWELIRGPLAEAAPTNVPAAHWFALPDGTYWTLEQGRMPARLSDRPYFPRVLAGNTVIGELVVSRSSSRNSAIVAVPVRGHDGSIVGVLGHSVDLERLSAIVRDELGGLPEGVFFFAIDAEPLGALHSDPGLIFTEPMKLGDEGMRRAFAEMLAHGEGAVTYEFRGSSRTVLYRRSALSGWWYGFGIVER